MIKNISKRDLLKKIENSEPLEILIEEIDRSSSDSKKNSKLSSYIRGVKSQIKDQRDVILVSIKVK